MQDQSCLSPFKIAVLGDAGVGKTSLISRIKTGTSSNEYVPTIDYETGDVNWLTNYGTLVLDLWDISGSHCSAETRAECLRDSQGAIIVVDRSEQTTVDNALLWYREFVSFAGEHAPVSICSTKPFLARFATQDQPDSVDWPAEMGNVTYYHISSDDEDVSEDEALHVYPSKWDIPFCSLFSALTNLPDLVLTSGLLCSGIPAVPDSIELQEFRREMENAASQLLPDESDSDL